MSCEREGHVGAEDHHVQPKYRCMYCGSWGYRSRWSDGCCEHDGETHTPEGELIYPEYCDHDCHSPDDDDDVPRETSTPDNGDTP